MEHVVTVVDCLETRELRSPLDRGGGVLGIFFRPYDRYMVHFLSDIVVSSLSSSTANEEFYRSIVDEDGGGLTQY